MFLRYRKFARSPRRRSAAHCCCRACVRVALYCGAYACPTWETEALVDQSFFQGGQEQQDVLSLTAVAHQAHAPDSGFQRAQAAGDFDIEFIEELIAHL